MKRLLAAAWLVLSLAGCADPVTELKKLGGEMDRNPAGEVLGLSFQQPRVTDAGLAHVQSLTSLQQLDLQRTEITDDGLMHLRSLTQLQRLYLDRTQITSAGLVHLSSLTALQWIRLDGTNITDDGLLHLVPLQQLEGLQLLDTRITDAGLVHLHRLPKLRTLMLAAGQLTPGGLSALQTALPQCQIVLQNKTGDWTTFESGSQNPVTVRDVQTEVPALLVELGAHVEQDSEGTVMEVNLNDTRITDRVCNSFSC